MYSFNELCNIIFSLRSAYIVTYITKVIIFAGGGVGVQKYQEKMGNLMIRLPELRQGLD
jgi:methyl coenzyme M reductase subunit C